MGRRSSPHCSGFVKAGKHIQTTAAKRLMEDEAVGENAMKKAWKEAKGRKERTKATTDKERKQMEQGTLTIGCHTKSTAKARICCAGGGCHESWATPRMSGRILPHASAYQYLPADLRNLALLDNAKVSLSSKLDGAETSGTQPDMFAGFCRPTNHLVVNLLCDGTLPPSLVDNRAFRALVNHLEAGNGIVVGTTFSTNYIPAEAARVTVAALEKLKKCYNLTISYDGGSTKGGQSIYTIHVTTADCEPYLIKGNEALGVSHTGKQEVVFARGIVGEFYLPFKKVWAIQKSLAGEQSNLNMRCICVQELL
ncbi:hypothetical protein B0H10DRAFT_1943334 [Mycena sp. CBHHK59/15]|nr:hypothetical protein B0H10DRAFT_1943334 [Mycena sp. CBHHK59/15]